ncbi:MAG: hypothetical protein NVS3B20_02330 [Polyangiales bacterium]
MVLTALMINVALPSLAIADPAAEVVKSPAQLKAETHYKRARELYQLGRYREAIAQLEAALRLDPQGAELLYNLGLIHEKLGDVDEAIDAYRRYLRTLGPDADQEEKSKVEGIVRRLDGAKSELKVREAKRTEHRLTPLSTSLLVTSGLSLLATAYFGVSAIRGDHKARNYVVSDRDSVGGREILVSASKRDAAVADVAAAVALLSGGAAVALYFTAEFPKRDNPSELPPSVHANVIVEPLIGGGRLRLEVAF